MRRLTLLAIFSLLFLLPTLAAQGGPWVRLTDPAKIEAAYRSQSPYNEIDFVRVDRPPFIFFIQLQKKGQSAKDVSYLADSRFAALTAIVKLFSESFAKPLHLKARPRPMPYWILKDRDTYTKKMGGSQFSGAYYSLTDMHTMTYEDRGRSTHETFATSMHEAVHQIMFQYTDPKRSLQQNVLSGWLMEGMAEHLSSRPHGPMLKGRDPGFGFLDKKKIAKCRSTLNRAFTWKRMGSINFFHNPMQVMHYQSLQQYLRATGVKLKATTDTERADYSSQMGIFYRAAYSITSFLDRGYKGFYRPKLLKIMSFEYGCPDAEGNMMPSIHGIRAIRKSFTPEELAALPNRFADFVRNPTAVVDMEMPEGASETVAAVGTGGAGSLFADPRSGSKASLPVMKKADEEVPILVDLGRALELFKKFRLSQAKELIEDIDDPVAEKLGKSIEGLQSLLDAFLAKAKARPGKTKIKISMAGAKAQTWAILDYRPSEGVLTVKRKGEETSVGLGELRPSYFAEAVFKYKLVKDDAQKSALGLGIQLELDSLSDSKRERSIRKLVKKKFIPLEHAWLKELEDVVRMTSSFEKASTEVRISKKGERILESLSSSIGNMKKSAERDWLVRRYVPRMLDSVFLKSAGWSKGLRGTVKLLSGNKVRVEYDWSSGAQSRDWIFVDPIKGGFALPEQYYGRLRKDERPREVKVDVKNQRLQVFGNGFVRHKLQFDGDVKITFEWALGITETADGRQINITPLMVLLNALRPNSLLSAEVGITGGGLKVIERGKRRSTANYKRDSFRKIVQGVVGGQSLTFERKGDKAYLRMGPETILTAKRADKIPNMGALGFVARGAGLSEKNRGPTLEVGKVTIEGTPHEESLKAAKTVFLNRWIRRFPGLN